jgi:hypothetical protein
MMDGDQEYALTHVAHFVEVFHLFSSSVLSNLPQLSGLSDVVREVRGGRIPRRDVLTGGLQYQVHGMGCVLIGPNGAIVNVDFLADGRAIFDASRLEDFIRSTNPGLSVSQVELLAACRLAVREGLVSEAREGWFAIPPRLRSGLE